jgi:hypothetical protein
VLCECEEAASRDLWTAGGRRITLLDKLDFCLISTRARRGRGSRGRGRGASSQCAAVLGEIPFCSSVTAFGVIRDPAVSSSWTNHPCPCSVRLRRRRLGLGLWAPPACFPLHPAPSSNRRANPAYLVERPLGRGPGSPGSTTVHQLEFRSNPSSAFAAQHRRVCHFQCLAVGALVGELGRT